MTETLPMVRVRIAPSPTGDWHLGNARTALFSWLFARKHKGAFYLRIEDTDQTRLVEGAVDRLLHLLTWLGMSPDPLPNGEPFFVQSQNLRRYQEVAEGLVRDGKAYYCFATAEELATMRQEQETAKQPPRYDNRWGYRDLSLEEAHKRIAQGTPYVIRQKMPTDGETVLQDAIRGEVMVENRLLDDQVILKSDGFPTYHLAHIVDDHDMNITHVIRGDEWLPSAPRHVQLYQSLGWEVPVYAHVPIILGPDKGKLSKRHGAQPVYAYEEEGYLPEALVNFLVLLGWSSGTEQEVFTREELIAAFDLARVQPSPAVFDATRLNWFNGRYIRSLSNDALVDRLKKYWEKYDSAWYKRISEDETELKAVVASLQDRLTTLREFRELASFYYAEVAEYPVELLATKQQTLDEVKHALGVSRTCLENLDTWSHEGLESALRRLAEEQGIKAGAILWPLRVALTGLPASPSTFAVLEVLGKEVSLKRIDTALARL